MGAVTADGLLVNVLWMVSVPPTDKKMQIKNAKIGCEINLRQPTHLMSMCGKHWFNCGK